MLKDPILHPRFTYGDYRQWMGDERWELIDGEAYLMSPAPKRRHQRASMGLSAQIANALEGGSCQVYAAPFDVRLPDGDEADDDVATVVQPDVVVICDPAKLDDAGCRGAPDWVVEILSPSTTARDRIDKRDLYQ
ncbi:MAG: Uma2 family endonuclease, partial [Myxococcales bacterium]|nr:Uma2 family endonuclease [Myxococcales bacterium]